MNLESFPKSNEPEKQVDNLPSQEDERNISTQIPDTVILEKDRETAANSDNEDELKVSKIKEEIAQMISSEGKDTRKFEMEKSLDYDECLLNWMYT